MTDDGAPPPPAGAPAAPRTRYPGYDVLRAWDGPGWDEQTRAVVRRRLAEPPPLRFLTVDEARTLGAAVEHLVPQGDRAAAERVPIVPWIDEKLHLDQRDGYRYEDLPPLREAWRLGIAGLDESARLLHGAALAELAAELQADVLRRVQRGDAPGETWRRLPPRRFFRDVLALTVVKLHYAHPTAWSEIGYGGPAAVRGHVRNWMGGVDPWDAPEGPPR